MKKNSLLALVMAAILALAGLTGCGKPAPSNPKPSKVKKWSSSKEDLKNL